MNIKVSRFAKQMQIELDNNSHKGSILEWVGIYDKIADFEYHKAKMLIAIRTGDKNSTKEYIADCANILLAIGNEIGLYDKPSKNTGIVSELKTELFDHVPAKDPKKATNFIDNILNN